MASELGSFLRARRLLVSPQSAAYQPAGRRRVDGLRREEVAAASGISADYYTRLEQGRVTNPSDSVLDALARVLGLDDDGARHLRVLRAAADGHHVPQHPVVPEDLRQRMAALVDAVRPNPAYVLDGLSTFIAANAESLALLDGLADLPPHLRNTCRYLVTHPRAREVFVDWADVARGSVAQLRAANADRLDDPGLMALVAELGVASDDFRRWWEGHDVGRRRSSEQHIRRPDGTVRRYRYEILHLPDAQARMTIYLPTS